MGTDCTIKVGILTAPHIEWEQHEHTFLIRGVRIGIGFHWDRHEDQEFEGRLEIRQNPDHTETAINHIALEDYLTSVISSEMNANSPMELLKAHTIIARSWLLRNLGKHADRGYDVCGDDCCQRYEGIHRRNERAVQAVRETAGMVLTYDGEVCDCRYYKCCGGQTEVPSTCWDDLADVPYLSSVSCRYCNTTNVRVLSTVLNNYDRETLDFHDWTARYDDEDIVDLIPRKRGASGRIIELDIVHRDGRIETVGKELAIRRRLSSSCLYSSWFDVEKTSDGHFLLHGHGWGHGVGLCQIGAAVWADEGATCEQILHHYYPGAKIADQAFLTGYLHSHQLSNQ